MIRRKKNKGFTLIELLVVVAIIGILASVGVVAYNGYTQSAKKGASKSNHNSVKKWVQNELQKCNIGESKAMEGNLDCDTNKSDADEIIKAVVASLGASDDFSNPYAPATNAISSGAKSGNCDTDDRGVIHLSNTSGVKIETCTAKYEDAKNTNLLTNTVNVE